MAFRPMSPEYDRAVVRLIGDFTRRLPAIRKAYEAAKAMQTPAGDRYRLALDLIRQSDIARTLHRAGRMSERDLEMLKRTVHDYGKATRRACRAGG